MNVDRVVERALSFEEVSAARLDGFQLKFNKRSRATPVSGRANISRDCGSTVFGVLYRLQQPEDIMSMDAFEHAPIDYRRRIVEVQSRESTVTCWTYIANDRVVDDTLKPTRTYLNHLIAGHPYLPNAYVKQLKQVSCMD